MKQIIVAAAAALASVMGVSAVPFKGWVGKGMSNRAASNCSREFMTAIVAEVLDSMVAHDPTTLPLAEVYQATENSHPAALGMMTLWRTVTKADAPSILAIDTTIGSAYFALAISEGSDEEQSVLRARIKVADSLITELELYITRSRGDHGFSFSAAELADNYAQWMAPPADRQVATRAQLEALGEASFDPTDDLNVTVAEDCQFTEEGWSVVDPGPDGDGSTEPLGCSWRSDRPGDTNARNNLVIDEEYGIIVTGGVIPGTVYPYGNISAFIPDDMVEAQEEQEEWLEGKLDEGGMTLLSPSKATGETIYLFQYYDNELQGHQINVHLAGPDMESVWTQ